MGRKVFISFLGTGCYGECIYTNGLSTSSLTRFIQTATLELIGAKEWTKDDRILILLTSEARRNNWKKDIQTYTYNNGKSVPYYGLEKEICDSFSNTTIKDVPLNNGSDIWDMFDTINENIPDNCDLYIDLTLGYRYMPMLMLVLRNYVQITKENVNVKHMSYGYMDEANKSQSQIIDLMPLAALQDWTTAAIQYIKDGHAESLAGLSKGECRLLKKKIHTTNSQSLDLEASDDDANSLDKLTGLIDRFNNDLITCRGRSLIESKSIGELKNQFIKVNKSFIRAFNPIIEKIAKECRGFSEQESINNCFIAAKWCFEKNLFQQAATFLEEFVFLFLFERHNLPYHKREDADNSRQIVTEAINKKARLNNLLYKKKKQEKDQVEIDRVVKEITSSLNPLFKDTLFEKKGFVSTLFNLIDLRNDYNHCGFRWANEESKSKEPLSPNKIKANIESYIKEIEEVVYEDDRIILSPGKHIFVNISNHPTSKWSAKQLGAAREYGEIYDIPFPDISGEGDEYYINEIADNLLESVQKLSSDWSHIVTCHIMGEMTFTYNLVQKLSRRGVTCVASTTNRIVEELPDGKKTVQFSFDRFRRYE